MAKFHDNDDLEDGKWIEWSEGISGWSVQPCAINCATCVHNILLLVCLQCVFTIFYCWCVNNVFSKYFTAGVFTMCVQNILLLDVFTMCAQNILLLVCSQIVFKIFFWCVYNILLHALYNIFHVLILLVVCYMCSQYFTAGFIIFYCTLFTIFFMILFIIHSQGFSSSHAHNRVNIV